MTAFLVQPGPLDQTPLNQHVLYKSYLGSIRCDYSNIALEGKKGIELYIQDFHTFAKNLDLAKHFFGYNLHHLPIKIKHFFLELKYLFKK